MSLIKCKECGKEISDKAKKCVYCGCPIEDIKNKSNLTNTNGNNDENKNGINILIGAIVLVPLVFLIFIGYRFNWFSFLGINSLGINGCYYKEDGKEALCFDNKKAYFTFDNKVKYYVKYYENYLELNDEYGNHFSTCKKVEDSKNIICGSMVLYKK